jgi:hypothetical protein
MSDREMSKDEVLEEENARSSTASAMPPTPADLLRTAADPALTEGFALALLKRPDLPPEVIEQLAKNNNALKSRKVKIALAGHPHTPRHVSVPLARQFYTFDLMKVALSPTVPADVKVAVDDVLILRLKTVTIGERLTLARRASGRVAAALLLDVETIGTKIIDAKTIARETRVMQAALENPRGLGAGGSAAREVVPPKRNPCRPSANRASLISPRPGIQSRNPHPAAARTTYQFASPRPNQRPTPPREPGKLSSCKLLREF